MSAVLEHTNSISVSAASHNFAFASPSNSVVFGRHSINFGDDTSSWRRRIAHLLASPCAQIVLTCIILINMVCIIYQTDSFAADSEPPVLIRVIDDCLLSLYVIELSLRFFVFRREFFQDTLNVVDFTVVVIDVALEFLDRLTAGEIPSPFSFIRVIRIVRVARSYRAMVTLPRLSGMVRDLLGAMETIFWGCLLLGICVMMWSILTVQLVHGYIEELVREGSFDNCPRCSHAYSTVANAMLTNFQMIIIGDSWGEVHIPIIEAHPWTAFLFIAVFVTIELGIMNVILAVIVESAEDARKADVQEKLKQKEKLFFKRSKKLITTFQSIDADGSGDISLHELLDGYDTNQLFAVTLLDMGIERDDLEILFDSMDADRYGQVDYKEFVHHMLRMKTADEIAILNFIRHYVMQIMLYLKDTNLRPREAALKRVQQRKKIRKHTKDSLSSARSATPHLSTPSKPPPSKSKSSIEPPLDVITRVHTGASKFTLVSEQPNDIIIDTAASDVGETSSSRNESALSVSKAISPNIENTKAIESEDVLAVKDLCNTILARVNDDIVGVLADVSRKCDEQVMSLASLGKLLLPASVKPSPVPKPVSMNHYDHGFGCVLGSCSIEKPPLERILPREPIAYSQLPQKPQLQEQKAQYSNLPRVPQALCIHGETTSNRHTDIPMSKSSTP